MPPLYNLLSIGVTVVREEQGRHVLGDSWYVELKPLFPGFEPEALAVCGLDMERLKTEGTDPGQAMGDLRDWVLEQNHPCSDRPVFVGHNAPFDWSYISYYFTWAKIRNPFGYKALDTKALAMGKLDIPWLATNKDVLEQYMPEIGSEDMSQKHRADYDARFQARILAALLDYDPKARARAARKKTPARRKKR